MTRTLAQLNDTRPIRPWSSFPTFLFGPGYIMHSIDPDTLPHPSDVIPGFSGPCAPQGGFSVIADAWEPLAERGIDPISDPRRATLVNLARTAEAAGLFYNTDVNRAICDALELPQDDPERLEHSSFGTEVYFARRFLTRVKAMAAEARAWAELALHTGQKLPPMRINDKRVNAVRINSLQPPELSDRDGQLLALKPAAIVLTGKRGSQTLEIRTSAAGLQHALNDHLRSNRRA